MVDRKGGWRLPDPKDVHNFPGSDSRVSDVSSMQINRFAELVGCRPENISYSESDGPNGTTSSFVVSKGDGTVGFVRWDKRNVWQTFRGTEPGCDDEGNLIAKPIWAKGQNSLDVKRYVQEIVGNGSNGK